jgi:hypothetical protein
MEYRPQSLGTGAMLAYVAELELEVDRLRKHGEMLYQESTAVVKRVLEFCRLERGCETEE